MKRQIVKFNSEGKSDLKLYLESYWIGKEQPVILEAGCGSGSNINIPDNAKVYGIDISQDELDKNKVVHHKIVGDLETFKLPENAYDLVVCWDVLEHLNRPSLAMKSMASSVKTGGLLLLAFPNVHSLKAVVAKYTPLWFHSAINRFIYGEKAGQPGYINFPTILDPSISPYKMEEFAQNTGLEIELAYLGQSGVQRRFFNKILIGHMGAQIADRIIRCCSIGKLSIVESDCIFLFRKIQ